MAKLKFSHISWKFGPEQNDAGLESIAQTVQKLQHFQMLVIQNSRWPPAAKMADFFDIAWRIDFYCQEVYLCQRGCL
jgi:hypothetical protein